MGWLQIRILELMQKKVSVMVISPTLRDSMTDRGKRFSITSKRKKRLVLSLTMQVHKLEKGYFLYSEQFSKDHSTQKL